MRMTSGGPGTPPVRFIEDIESLSKEELRERIDFLKGNRSMIPSSSKGGSRKAAVVKAKPQVEEESI